MNEPPLIVHLLHRLGVGGMETLLIERINRMAPHAFRHAVVSLTEIETAMASRLRRGDVELIALHKPAGLALGLHREVYRVLRRLGPAVLHAYNLGALEYVLPARWAGVGVCIHGSHGREADDPNGMRRRHLLLRRAAAPLYDCCYANSRDLLAWLRGVVHVPHAKSCLLPNGVDLARFICRSAAEPGAPIVIGSVCRLVPVKDPGCLLAAFAILRERLPHLRARLILQIAGGGRLLEPLRQRARDMGLAGSVRLLGERSDIPDVLEQFRVFALTSIAEGCPGAILEAMAAGLPVVATRVGGVPDLVDDGVTGRIVPPSQPQAVAAALEAYVLDAALAAHHGAAGRERAEREFGMQAMVQSYQGLYTRLLQPAAGRDACAG